MRDSRARAPGAGPRGAAAGALLTVCLLAGCNGERNARDAPWAVTEVPTPAAPGSAQAHLATTAGGEAVLSWLAPSDGGHSLEYALLADGAWSTPQVISSGDDWFVNWADFPSVVPIDDANWIAHWLVLDAQQRYTYDIAYAVSDNAGRSWSARRILNEDETLAEHGFVTFFPWGDDIGVVWLDGRRVAELDIDELLSSETVVGMSLRYARLDRTGRVLMRGEVDDLVCDCCQTDAAVSSKGPVVIYRDRSDEERRDVVVRRIRDSVFSEPLELGAEGWTIDGCPVNGPAIDALGDEIAAAWFTAAEGHPRVRFARSTNGGDTFASAVDVATSGAFGQVDVVLLPDGEAFVSWWARADDGGMNLVARSIDAADRPGAVHVVAHTPERLPVDVPQMQHVGDTLVFAWSQLQSPAGIFTATAPIW
jgi:hypothetical protein